jgi:hypothetical protein
VCHVREGSVLGAHGRSASRAAHDTRRVTAMATSAYCAGCHQFNFPADPGPGATLFATDEPMQDTHAEWQMSAAAADGVQCQDCHMPERTLANGRRYRSHRFAGSRDPEMLRRAVDVEIDAVREGGEVVVTARVAGRGIGHAFPTGDLFRRAELRVWLQDDEASARVHGFARAFAPSLEESPRGEPVFVRRQVADTRVPPPGLGEPQPIVFRFSVPAGRPVRLRWAMDHLLMPTPQAASQGLAEPRVRTRFREGTLEVTP